MRLTKGKFKKLLKKKNQTKRNKRPLKSLKSNKTLKPKKKIFDLSKKTFKNRQLYGGEQNVGHTDVRSAIYDNNTVFNTSSSDRNTGNNVFVNGAKNSNVKPVMPASSDVNMYKKFGVNPFTTYDVTNDNNMDEKKNEFKTTPSEDVINPMSDPYSGVTFSRNSVIKNSDKNSNVTPVTSSVVNINTQSDVDPFISSVLTNDNKIDENNFDSQTILSDGVINQMHPYSLAESSSNSNNNHVKLLTPGQNTPQSNQNTQQNTRLSKSQPLAQNNIVNPNIAEVTKNEHNLMHKNNLEKDKINKQSNPQNRPLQSQSSNDRNILNTFSNIGTSIANNVSNSISTTKKPKEDSQPEEFDAKNPMHPNLPAVSQPPINNNNVKAFSTGVNDLTQNKKDGNIAKNLNEDPKNVTANTFISNENKQVHDQKHQVNVDRYNKEYQTTQKGNVSQPKTSNNNNILNTISNAVTSVVKNLPNFSQPATTNRQKDITSPEETQSGDTLNPILNKNNINEKNINYMLNKAKELANEAKELSNKAKSASDEVKVAAESLAGEVDQLVNVSQSAGAPYNNENFFELLSKIDTYILNYNNITNLIIKLKSINTLANNINIITDKSNQLLAEANQLLSEANNLSDESSDNNKSWQDNTSNTISQTASDVNDTQNNVKKIEIDITTIIISALLQTIKVFSEYAAELSQISMEAYNAATQHNPTLDDANEATKILVSAATKAEVLSQLADNNYNHLMDIIDNFKYAYKDQIDQIDHENQITIAANIYHRTTKRAAETALYYANEAKNTTAAISSSATSSKYANSAKRTTAAISSAAAPTSCPPTNTPQLNLNFETIEYTKFLEDIEKKSLKYNTDLTQNLVSHIKFYKTIMDDNNYFYDTNVGEYKVSYLYTEQNKIKNIYFAMFYYINKFGDMKNILQCLFMYNTIISDKMPQYISEITKQTLSRELPAQPAQYPCILFYENSTNFIMTYKDNVELQIKDFDFKPLPPPTDVSNKFINIINSHTKTNYKHMLYFNNDIQNYTLVNNIINPIITPIIDSKVSSQ